jgi:energy-coupling factor transporter ATP-binding protein EcfA2
MHQSYPNFFLFSSTQAFFAHFGLTNPFKHHTARCLTLTVKVKRPVKRPSFSAPSSQPLRERQEEESIQEPLSLHQALSDHLLLVGEPGAGKSTLLRWLAMTFAKRLQQQTDRVGPQADVDRLPILVELGQLPARYLSPQSGDPIQWMTFLPTHLAEQDYLYKEQDYLHKLTPDLVNGLIWQALQQGRCLLLFDGLDEVADPYIRERLARSLVTLASLHPNNRIVIGSRPGGLSGPNGPSEIEAGLLQSRFHRCEIERFTPEDIRKFFLTWYELDITLSPMQQRRALTLFTHVQAQPDLVQLAMTPLFCVMLLLIWHHEHKLPARRVELYEYCCRQFLQGREKDHATRFEQADLKEDREYEHHLSLLASVAYRMHEGPNPGEPQTSISQSELESILGKGVLETWGRRSGLLQYRGNDRYGFSHFTFQEYLAARHIAAQPDPDYIDSVMNHLHEAWWQQVHLFTIGQLGSGKTQDQEKAAKLLKAILEQEPPPSWWWQTSPLYTQDLSYRWWQVSPSSWVSLIKPGRYFPRIQMYRQITWILARNLELACRGHAECLPAGEGPLNKVRAILVAQGKRWVRSIMQIASWGEMFNDDLFLQIFGTVLSLHRALHQQHDKTIIIILLAALRDPRWQVRRVAARCLGHLGQSDQPVREALLAVLYEDKNEEVRRGAAESLGHLGQSDPQAREALLEALRPRVAQRDDRKRAL